MLAGINDLELCRNSRKNSSFSGKRSRPSKRAWENTPLKLSRQTRLDRSEAVAAHLEWFYCTTTNMLCFCTIFTVKTFSYHKQRSFWALNCFPGYWWSCTVNQRSQHYTYSNGEDPPSALPRVFHSPWRETEDKKVMPPLPLHHDALSRRFLVPLFASSLSPRCISPQTYHKFRCRWEWPGTTITSHTFCHPPGPL